LEEYKDLKAEVKAKEAKVNAEPEPLAEDEAKAAAEKEVNNLTDKAEADRNAKKEKLATEEIAHLEKD